MNWVGGARSRVKFQGDRRLQKEFFEKKKLDLKFEKLQKASVCHSTKKKKKLSQDLVALHTVNIASIKAGNSPRAVNVQHVDLDHRRVGLSGRMGNKAGSHLSRVPDSVELPYSPDVHLHPSRLQLTESLTSSGKERDVNNPYRPKSTVTSSSSHKIMDSSLRTLSDPNISMSVIHKNENEALSSYKRMQTPHSSHFYPESQMGFDWWTASNVKDKSTERTRHFYEPSALNKNIVHSESRTRNPWFEEEFQLFDMRKGQEEFRSLFSTPQIFGTSDQKKTSRNVEKEHSQLPCRETHVQQHPKEVWTDRNDRTLSEHRTAKHLSSQTSIFTHNKDFEDSGGSQPSLRNIWTSFSKDTNYQMVSSPLGNSTQPIPDLSRSNSNKSSLNETVQTYKEVDSRRKHVTSNSTTTMPPFDDHMNTSSKTKRMLTSHDIQTHTEGNIFKRRSSFLECDRMKSSSFIDLEIDDDQSKLKRLRVPEDFQSSPPPLLREDSKTPSITLSSYTLAFKKPSVSKWNTFLETSDKPNSPLAERFNVPHTPSPNFWNTPLQRQQTGSARTFLDSRVADRERISPFVRKMWAHSDSEISSRFTQRAVSTTTKSSSMGQSDKSQHAANGSSSPHHQNRETECKWTSKTSSGTVIRTPELDCTHDLLAQRHMMSLKEHGKNAAAEHIVPTGTSACIRLTTTMTSVLKHQPPKPVTPRLWPKKESRAEEVLQELEQLEALSDTDESRLGTERKALLDCVLDENLNSPSQMKKTHQDTPKNQANQDKQDGVTASHESGDSESDPSQPTDGVRTEFVQYHDDKDKRDGQLDEVEINEELLDSFETVPEPAPLDSTDLGSDECCDAESDIERVIHDAVEAMVHNVVMTENRSELTEIQKADVRRSRLVVPSASKTDSQEIDENFADILRHKPQVNNSVHDQCPKDKLHQTTRHVSVHVQTNWSLMHLDVPSNWLLGETSPSVKKGVDQGVQWESPLSRSCSPVAQQDTEIAKPGPYQCPRTPDPTPCAQNLKSMTLPPSDEPKPTESVFHSSKTATTLDISPKQNVTETRYKSPRQHTTSQLLPSNINVGDHQQASEAGLSQTFCEMHTENLSVYDVKTQNLKIQESVSFEEHMGKTSSPSLAECKHCDENLPALANPDILSISPKEKYLETIQQSDQNKDQQVQESPTCHGVVHHQNVPEHAVTNSSSPLALKEVNNSSGDAVRRFSQTKDTTVIHQKLITAQTDSVQRLTTSEKHTTSASLIPPIKGEIPCREMPCREISFNDCFSSDLTHDSPNGIMSAVSANSLAATAVQNGTPTFSSDNTTVSFNQKLVNITAAPCHLDHTNNNQTGSTSSCLTETDTEKAHSDSLPLCSPNSSECQTMKNGIQVYEDEKGNAEIASNAVIQEDISLQGKMYQIQSSRKQQYQRQEQGSPTVLKKENDKLVNTTEE